MSDTNESLNNIIHFTSFSESISNTSNSLLFRHSSHSACPFSNIHWLCLRVGFVFIMLKKLYVAVGVDTVLQYPQWILAYVLVV